MAADISTELEFRGFMHCFSTISQKEAFTGMYWGFAAAALGIAAFRLSFETTLYLQNQQRKNKPKHKSTYLASVVGLIVAYPFHTIKCRMIMMAGRDFKS